MAQRVGGDGALLGQVWISEGVPDSQALPAVPYDSQHNQYLVVWTGALTDYAADGDVYGRLVAPDGACQAAFVVSAAPASEKRVAVAYNADSDDFLVVWDSGQGVTDPAQPYDVYGQRVTGAGQVAGERYAISMAAYGQFSSAGAYNTDRFEYLVL